MTVQDLDPTYDPELDLVLERDVDVSPDWVWQAWTNPEYLKQWFAPAPWSIADAEVDIRPGGIFATTMQSPEGDHYPNRGCVLEVIEGERLVFTSALAPGFRPTAPSNSAGDLSFTAIIVMEPRPLESGETGCRYTAIAKHATSESRLGHEEMGFHEGWGAVLDQLVALVHSVNQPA